MLLNESIKIVLHSFYLFPFLVPEYISIDVSPIQPNFTVGNSPVLNCTVRLNNSFINSQLSITFEWQLNQSTISSSDVYQNSSSPPLDTTYSSTYQLDNISPSDAGNYSCSVYVYDIDNGIQSDIITEYYFIVVIEGEF